MKKSTGEYILYDWLKSCSYFNKIYEKTGSWFQLQNFFKQAKQEHTELSKEIEKLDIAYYQDDAPKATDAEYDEIRRSIININQPIPIPCL